MRYLTRILITITCFAGLLAGCGGEKDEPEALPEARPLLEESAALIQTADSLEVELDVSGYPVKIDTPALHLAAGVPLFFKYARGVFQSPDRISASIQFSLDALSTTAQLIALDRDHYFRFDVLGNYWFRGELIPGFSPAALMARPGGIAYALASITELEMVGREDLDGVPVFHLQGIVQAGAVHALTFGLIRTREGDLKIEVYIQTANRHVSLIKIHDPPPENAERRENTTWTISIVDYNQDVSIVPPPEDEITNQ